MMKEIFLTFAQYNDDADKAFVAILDKLSNDDREKNRKSYFGSLSGLARHVLAGTDFFLGRIKDGVPKNAAAQKALQPLAKIEILKEKKLSEEQWKKVTAGIKAADKAYINFVDALSDTDLDAPVKWFDKPEEVPLSFALQILTAHNVHHRGQISQVLDSLKIDNDFSGINAKFLPKK
jgi:uncharacterized damage-inducible protein DinB